MKKIFFPVTNRVHIPRQQLLLDKLKTYFEVIISPYEPRGNNMADKAVDVANHYLKELQEIKPDLLLARADRFEILPIVMVASYLGIPIAHIEGGDLSSVIDGKVRHSISHLADYHFPTNWDAYSRLIQMGLPNKNIWNFGSLDVEFAANIEAKRLKDKPYLFTIINGFTNFIL